MAYGRFRVSLIHAELVRQGYAWVYRRYAKDKELYRLEKEAQEGRRGLCSSDHPIPPWEWRRGKRTVDRGNVACMMDAKQCPDGSWVSRKPPGCQFAPCPGEE
ncbi:MAG: thermonuclease family protein [Gammaproteobacteria bacterium]|nr:thermonuclease family protein [Gammaproteobacteria bacterium]